MSFLSFFPTKEFQHVITLGKSFSEVSDLELKNGRIRTWCENWDRNFEKSKNWDNHFNVSSASKEYLYWLDNEAYK